MSQRSIICKIRVVLLVSRRIEWCQSSVISHDTIWANHISWRYSARIARPNKHNKLFAREGRKYPIQKLITTSRITQSSDPKIASLRLCGVLAKIWTEKIRSSQKSHSATHAPSTYRTLYEKLDSTHKFSLNAQSTLRISRGQQRRILYDSSRISEYGDSSIPDIVAYVQRVSGKEPR